MAEQLDHKAFLAGLSPEVRRELTALRDGPGLRHVAVHLGLILGMGVYVGIGLPFWPLALFPLGLVLACLFMLQHECTHLTPFRTPWLNHVLGHLAGLIILQPFLWFRAFHMAHHRHTNDPKRDPELAEPKPDGAGALILYLVDVNYWLAKPRTLLGNAFGPLEAAYIPRRQRHPIRVEAWAMLSVYAALALSIPWTGALLFWVWLFPLALGFPVLRLYLLAEHGRCPKVANMFDNTRTTLTNRLVRFLAWNMPYHAEHHAWPAVPFHNLAAVHRLAEDHLRQVAPGYRAFTRAYVSGTGPSS